MDENNRFLAGRDNNSGSLMSIVIIVVVIMCIIAIMIYGGIFIGGFNSLKNYLISFKHNVIDSNRKQVAVN